ncbi:MAG: ferredoxin-thioredoxin reductase catalytic domain-containing protein, partial [archaeon]
NQLKQKLKTYAEENGLKLNDNEKVVEGIINGLLKNKENNGEAYCPCRMVTGDKEKDKAIICPCIYHKQEIKDQGHCMCRLFWKDKS